MGNLKKLDLTWACADNYWAMEKSIHAEAVHAALIKLGWTQTRLAQALGVSSQSVTNWLDGVNFPRPDKLLKLATTLRLSFDELVAQPAEGQPIVAFRKKAGAKTTEQHLIGARAIGMLLKPLVGYLPELNSLRRLITSPSTDYFRLQAAVSQARAELGLGELAVLDYNQLISEFKANGAVLVPVLRGERKSHENALHIRLPQDDVTFVFLNLDTRLEDFKFWMAHELAHVYTPDLAGKIEGEDFSDAFAGGLLFPQSSAELCYREASGHTTVASEVNVLKRYASKYQISVYTVYLQVMNFAKAHGLAPLCVTKEKINAIRNSGSTLFVSQVLFDPLPPSPAKYIAACENIFQSEFFYALKRMIRENGTGASYVQQVLDTSVQDSLALHEELRD